VLAAHESANFKAQCKGNTVHITCARTARVWKVECDDEGAAACLHDALKVVKKNMHPTWVHASSESLYAWRARH
jgi:hypothetical protein